MLPNMHRQTHVQNQYYHNLKEVILRDSKSFLQTDQAHKFLDNRIKFTWNNLDQKTISSKSMNILKINLKHKLTLQKKCILFHDISQKSYSQKVLDLMIDSQNTNIDRSVCLTVLDIIRYNSWYCYRSVCLTVLDIIR